jgi:chromosome segregation ATPase
VSLDGEVVRGAWVEGGRGGRGFLAPRREVKELKEREEAIDERLHELKAAKARPRPASKRRSAAIKQTEDAIHAAEKSLLSIDHARTALEDEKVRADRKLQVIDVEMKQAEAERAAGEVRIGEIDKELGAAEDERAQTAELCQSRPVPRFEPAITPKRSRRSRPRPSPPWPASWRRKRPPSR